MPKPSPTPEAAQRKAAFAQQGAKTLRKVHDHRNSTAEQRKKTLDYHRSYNEQNRERLRELKKKRYATDPEYRELVRQRARSAYQKKKLLRDAVREMSEKGTLPQEMGRVAPQCCPTCGQTLPKPNPPKMMLVRGKYEVMMYPIGVLAAKLGKQARTIDLWIKKGVIPDALHKNKLGRRLWSQDQVELLMRVCAKFDLRPPINYEKCGFVAAVKAAWKTLVASGGIDPTLYTRAVAQGRFRRPDAGELPPLKITSRKVLYLSKG